MITPAYVSEMADYSRWQNDTTYRLCDEIGQVKRERDRGLFFGSIHHTLNHICLVNRSILTYLDGIMPERIPLDQMVWPDRERIENHPRDSGRHAVCCRARVDRGMAG